MKLPETALIRAALASGEYRLVFAACETPVQLVERVKAILKLGEAFSNKAIHVLGKSKKPAAKEAIRLLAGDDDFHLHNKAVRVLANDGPAAIAELEKIACDTGKPKETRNSAIYSLGFIKCDASILALERIMEKDFAESGMFGMDFGWWAAYQIREIGGSLAAPTVFKHLKKFEFSGYEVNVNRIFASFGHASKKILVGLIRDPVHEGERVELMRLLELVREKANENKGKVQVLPENPFNAESLSLKESFMRRRKPAAKPENGILEPGAMAVGKKRAAGA